MRTSHILLEDLEVEGVYENPEKAYELSCEYDPTVDFYDTDYPVEGSMIPMIKNNILKELLTKYKLPEDETNDGEDNMIQGAK